MFALSARSMGYRVHVFSPDRDSPAGQVADLEIAAPYDDLDAVRRFAEGVDALTFEFENVPSATAAVCRDHTRVRPDPSVLHVAQNRLREKEAVRAAGIGTTPFARVTSVDELDSALAEIGTPSVLKTAGWGYDGKGQRKIGRPEDAREAWASLKTDEAILEGFVEFEREVSVVGARDDEGNFVHFGVLENDHENHILDITSSPADVSEKTREQATDMARTIFEALDVVGVLCVEMFLLPSGDLLVNELAPRPHNSGHLTIDACVTSQFEQQVRAVAGLPLGDPEQPRPAAMANLLGDLWRFDDSGRAVGEPNWAAALAHPNVKLHLYGKAEPRRGRKMGHLTAVAADREAAIRAVKEARIALMSSGKVSV
jgi:5-(carboxyamino)imidazole ribonucleotide synthase